MKRQAISLLQTFSNCYAFSLFIKKHFCLSSQFKQFITTDLHFQLSLDTKLPSNLAILFAELYLKFVYFVFNTYVGLQHDKE